MDSNFDDENEDEEETDKKNEGVKEHEVLNEIKLVNIYALSEYDVS